MKKLCFFESASPDCYSQLAQMTQAQQTAQNLANAFILAKPALIWHLQKQYGHQLELNEIQSEMWLAVLRAGKRKGENLVSYVCNSVQRSAREGMSLLSYFDTENNECDLVEWIQGIDSNDPLTILIQREEDAAKVMKFGSVAKDGVVRSNKITDRGARKQIQKTLAHIEQGDLFRDEQGEHE